MEIEEGVAAERPQPEELEQPKPPPAELADGERQQGVSEYGELNRELAKADNTQTILALISEKVANSKVNAVNLATALHRLASINKRQRAGRDALLRDRRFEVLLDTIAERSAELSARSVADVLWSLATLQHWPATMLKPLLTSVATQIERDAFEAQHLSTCVWAFAKLECKPTRLLEQLELQAMPRLARMNTQNCANLLWGFAKLNYRPVQLLPELTARLIAPGMLDSAKPVEVADVAFALGLIGTSESHTALLQAIATRAAPDSVFGSLHSFSSRQIVILIWAVARLNASACLPEGTLDAWVRAVRAAHEAIPLLAHDARNLERSLDALGVDASWVARSDILNAWSDLALADGQGRRQAREYTEEELRRAFAAIDTDGSGDIDQDELLDAIKSIKPDADSGDVSKMLDFADSDGDKEVSFEEFKLIMQNMQKPTLAASSAN